MIRSKHLAPALPLRLLALLALAFVSAPILAQTAPADSAGSVTAPAEESAEQAAPTQQTPQSKESAPASSSAGNSGRSPFDYRSSEEISEDVPVSFPVDI